jgi:hypothetical protein
MATNPRLDKRMRELTQLIDGSISLTDDRQELLMLAFAMLDRSLKIFDKTIGEINRNKIIQEWQK